MTHFLQRTALILLSGSALCACSSTGGMRPEYPTREPATVATPVPPPPAAEAPPVSTEPTPQAPPAAAPVQQTELAPLAPAQPRLQAPAPQRYVPTPAAPQPTFQTTTRRTVTGKVVDVEGAPITYTVKKGDNLNRVADKLGSSVDTLQSDNDLKGSTIHPGQVLKGPKTFGKAYVVGQGDTLFSVGKRFAVTADALRDENGLSKGASIHADQKLKLPEGYRDRGAITTTERTATSAREDFPPMVIVRKAGPPPAPEVDESDQAPSAPSFRTVSRRTVTGKVVEVEGPRASYTVKSGDNLNRIADKLGTDVDTLKDDNDLKKTTIQPGQVLKGPATTSKAYVAGSGDTVAAVAKRFGLTEAALREANNLKRTAQIRPGEKVKLPDGYRDRGPITVSDRVEIPGAPQSRPEGRAENRPQPTSEPAPRPYVPPMRATPVAEEPAALPTALQPYTPSSRPAQASSRPYSPPPAYIPPTPSTTAPRPYTPPPSSGASPVGAPVAAPSVSDLQISQLGRGRFSWPLTGEIISDFGPKAGNQRNDGINIRASAGDPVRAAAGGDVVYAGDQVPGFGNLVLIKHPDGWVTAYGHLSHVDVKMQQKVSAGQQIGQAGMTGGVSEPQLHFEVRYAPSPLERARPVDPKLVLPK